MLRTFAEEDEAHELLNNLSMSFPFIVIVIWIFDALLAAVYLKWLHPWKILLQKEPDQWGIKMENGAGTEQANEKILENPERDVTSFATSHGEEESPLLGERVDEDVKLQSGASSQQDNHTRSVAALASAQRQEDSPLSGERVVVEVELHSGASFQQVTKENKEDQESYSGEEETEV